jgi:putative SOS response-associated peptidase YedK
MCFYYALSQKAQSLKKRYQLQLDLESDPVFDFSAESYHYVSGFDYPKMPVILGENPAKLEALRWGLIPSWVKTMPEAENIRVHTLNARSESVFVKPSFRKAIQRQRCLVPADGFFEWRMYQGKKYPYFIYLKSREIFSFAGIWDEWTDYSTGEVRRTFSILTTEANALLARIHTTKKRMPVILPQSQEMKWLERGLSETEVRALTRPLDVRLLAAHTIGQLITSRTANRNTPEVRQFYDYPGLPAVL